MMATLSHKLDSLAAGAATRRIGGCLNRKDKAEKISLILENLYPDPPVPLDHTDPFTLLVAVLLSAQSTDKKVNEITPALFAEGGTPAAMAGLGVDRIRHLIRQIGLTNQKAKAIDKLSHMLVELHDSQVPASFPALEALPGVGHKTASVVMSQAFGIPAFAVDTHIHRLASRWGLSQARNVQQTEKDLKALFPKETWNRRHIQIIYFGREYCPARRHDLSTCPICGWASTKTRIEEERVMNLPKKRTKKPAKKPAKKTTNKQS